MSLFITGKGDLELLKNFQKDDFENYELYIKSFEESLYDKYNELPDFIKIISIHTPTNVNIDGTLHRFNLIGDEKIGTESLISLKNTIQFAKSINSKIIVVHGALYNKKNKNKEDAILFLAEQIKPLLQEEISLCFENDPLGYNEYSELTPLLTTKEDFEQLNKLLEGKLKITLDVEHLCLTYYFSKFVENIGGEKVFLERYPEKNLQLIEKDLQTFIKQNNLKLNSNLNEYIKSFFTTFKDQIEHIHLCGSDKFNWTTDPNIKDYLLGEHLPLGFNSKKKGDNTDNERDESIKNDEIVKDRLDYDSLMKIFQILPQNKKIHIVLEIGYRPEKSDFLIETRKSRDHLKNHFDFFSKKENKDDENDNNKDKILIFGAHLDDEVLGIGGTILKHKESRSHVTVCIITSPYTPQWSEDYITLKENQAKEVDKVLNINKRIYCNFPAAKLNTVPHIELYEAISKIIKEVKPTKIYTHYFNDRNIDHKIISKIVLSIVSASKTELLFFETPSSTEWGTEYFKPNTYININKHIDKKIYAFSKYTTEVKEFPHPRSLEGIKILAQKRGTECLCNFAESFILHKKVID